MAKKGFFRSSISAISAAILCFFIIYFFIPNMGMQFLGTSFAYREGTVNAQVLDALGQVNPQFTKESFAQFQSLITSPAVQDKLKEAAKEGQQALQSVVQQITDQVK